MKLRDINSNKTAGSFHTRGQPKVDSRTLRAAVNPKLAKELVYDRLVELIKVAQEGDEEQPTEVSPGVPVPSLLEPGQSLVMTVMTSGGQVFIRFSKDEKGELYAEPTRTGDFDKAKRERMEASKADMIARSSKLVRFNSGQAPLEKPAPMVDPSQRGRANLPSDLRNPGESVTFRGGGKYHKFYLASVPAKDSPGKYTKSLMHQVSDTPKFIGGGSLAGTPIEKEEADRLASKMEFVSAKGGYDAIADLFAGKSPQEQEQVFKNFLANLDIIRKNYDAAEAKYRNAIGGDVAEKYHYMDRTKEKLMPKLVMYTKNDIADLRRNLDFWSRKVERAGNAYARIVREVGIKLDEDKNIVWLKEKLEDNNKAVPGLSERQMQSPYSSPMADDPDAKPQTKNKKPTDVVDKPLTPQELAEHQVKQKEVKRKTELVQKLRTTKEIQEQIKSRQRLELQRSNHQLSPEEEAKMDSMPDMTTLQTRLKTDGITPEEAAELRSIIQKVGSFTSSPSNTFKVRVRHESGSPASPQELSAMLKSLGTSGIVEVIEPGVFRIDLPEELEHKLIIDGHFSVQIDQFVLESTADAVGGTDSGAEASLGGDTLSTPEMDGTGKVGQAMPPMAPPAGMPQPGPDTMPQPADGAPVMEEEPEDPRSMAEIADTIKSDAEVLSKKINDGNMMDGGMEMEPSITDTGATPAPPPKIAVDAPAKDYWSSMFGEYGRQMTRGDATVTATIRSAAKDAGVSLTEQDISSIKWWLAADPYADSKRVASLYSQAVEASVKSEAMFSIVGKLLVSAIMGNRDFGSLRNAAKVKPHVFSMAVHNAKLGNKMTRAIEAARKSSQKMKTPSVSKQPDDAVDVVEMKDIADSGERIHRTQHLDICIDDHWQEGAYIKMELCWDPDDTWNDAAVKHAVISYVKGLESKKEFEDFGHIGQINFDEFDPEAGFAVVFFKAARPADAPPKVVTD